MKILLLRFALVLLWARSVAVAYMLVLLVTATVARIFEAITRRQQDALKDTPTSYASLSAPSVTVLVPCYLPNEQAAFLQPSS